MKNTLGLCLGVVTFLLFSAGNIYAQVDKELMKEASAALAKEKKSFLKWYPPKVRPGKRKNTSIVKLRGKTNPYTRIRIDTGSIFVINRKDGQKNIAPRRIRSVTKSNRKGRFRLIIELPNGLNQVPVLFQRKGSKARKPILLTLDVTPRRIKMNVKVERKAKKIKERVFPSKTYVGLGVGFGSFAQNHSLASGTDLKASSSGVTNLRGEVSIQRNLWWGRGFFEAQALEFEKLSNVEFKERTAQYQKIILEGLYRLNRKDKGIWLAMALSQVGLPMSAMNSSNEMILLKTTVLNASVGVVYHWTKTKWENTGAFYYQHPVSLTVESGELGYEPKYAFQGSWDLMYRLTDKFQVGAFAAVDLSSYSFEVSNTPLTIFNDGSGTNLSISVLLKGGYQF